MSCTHKNVPSQPNSATNSGHQGEAPSSLAYRVFSSKVMGWVGEEVGTISFRTLLTVPFLDSMNPNMSDFKKTKTTQKKNPENYYAVRFDFSEMIRKGECGTPQGGVCVVFSFFFLFLPPIGINLCRSMK